jgi:uncharacterized membrane protein YhaH (DUF805 family)
MIDAANSCRGSVMNFGQAITSGFSNYVTFSSRAIRSEYWYWVLFTVIGGLVTGIIDTSMLGYDYGAGPVNGIFDLVTFLPSLAIGIRRLHDIDRTGWWILIALTVIGVIVLIVWACQKGTTGPNRFGPDRLPAQ